MCLKNGEFVEIILGIDKDISFLSSSHLNELDFSPLTQHNGQPPNLNAYDNLCFSLS